AEAGGGSVQLRGLAGPGTDLPGGTGSGSGRRLYRLYEVAGALNMERKNEGMTQTIASAPIAVVIPCYNHGQFLEEAVNSVAAASLRVPPDQVIIVNDGSDEAETL